MIKWPQRERGGIPLPHLFFIGITIRVNSDAIKHNPLHLHGYGTSPAGMQTYIPNCATKTDHPLGLGT